MDTHVFSLVKAWKSAPGTKFDIVPLEDNKRCRFIYTFDTPFVGTVEVMTDDPYYLASVWKEGHEPHQEDSQESEASDANGEGQDPNAQDAHASDDADGSDCLADGSQPGKDALPYLQELA